MALFGFVRPFRVRSPQRDRATDAARVARLNAMLVDLRVELERERDGLRGRYESSAMRAAFSQEALENDPARTAMSSAVDGLTDEMIRYSARMTTLGEQIAFVTEMRKRLDLFPHANEALEPSSSSAGERPA